MDTSVIYIKMCKKAPEIQNFHKEPSDGDFLYVNNKGVYNKYSLGESIFVFQRESWFEGFPSDINPKLKPVWLPRQDQLQEILIEECIGFVTLGMFEKFQIFCDKNWIQLKSFEQLWLAFVMNEKFNKIWNFEKKEWEEIK